MLGALARHGPMYGHQIRRDARMDRADLWSDVRPGSLYGALHRLAWISVAILGVVAVLGLVMAVRWVRVYRTHPKPGRSLVGKKTVPPERNFPLPVVIAHGLLGVTTIALVLVTTLGKS